MSIVISLLFFSTLFFSTVWFKKIINPISIFVSVQLLLLVASLFTNIIASNYSTKTYFILLSSYAVYIIGVFLWKAVHTLNDNNQKTFKIVTSRQRLLNCIILLSVITDICIIIYFRDLNSRLGLTYIISHLGEVNKIILEGFFSGKSYYILLNLGITDTLLIQYYLTTYKLERKKLFILQFFLCLIPFISVRRDMLIKIVFMNLILFYLMHSKTNERFSLKKVKKIFLAIISVIATVELFSYSQVLLNKSGAVEGLELFSIKVPNFLVDPLTYILGSFAYLDQLIISNVVNFKGFLISTLRIPYMYMVPKSVIGYDLISPFDLQFYNIGTNGESVLFNTAPIHFYILIETGIFYIFYFFILGYIVMHYYSNMRREVSLGSILSVVLLWNILFWSIREYTMIYLNNIIVIISCYIVCKYAEQKKEE